MNEVFVSVSVLNDEIKEIYKKSCFGDWSCLDDVKRLELIKHDGFYIDHVIRECCLLNLRNYGATREFDIHEWFKQNFKKILGNDYELSDFKNNPKHQPDVWLVKESELIPVEIKLNAFTEKSLTQLKRYMDFYNTKNGIAVADGLKCELPKNITFVDYKEWKKKGVTA